MGTYTGGCQCGAVRFVMEASLEGAVNVNVLDGIDPRAIAATAQHYDGRSA